MAKWEPVDGAIMVPHFTEDKDFDAALDFVAKIIYRKLCRFKSDLPTEDIHALVLPGHNQGDMKC